MTRHAPAVGIVLAAALGVTGGWLGTTIAEPRPAVRPSVVDATVSAPLTVGLVASELLPTPELPTREVRVGMTGDAIRADVLGYLAAITAEPDPAEAAGRLAPAFTLAGPDDSCAPGGQDCIAGIAGTVASVDPEPVPFEVNGRTVIFAPTPDLIVVTVAHDPGDTVRAYPNVINGDEPICDRVVAGYDLLVKPLGSVTVPYGGGARSSFAFDINEGLTVFLCAEVTPVGAGEVAYRAQATVRTADRLVPTVSVTSVDGQALPGWRIRGYLPTGERCGEFDVPGTGVPGQVQETFRRSRILCDLGDVPRPGSGGGRGVLPLSSGDRSTFTAELAYDQLPAERTSLSLGAPAFCTGVCLAPEDSYYAVRGTHGSVVLRVSWSQGNTNGSIETSVGAVSDNASPPPEGAQLDVASSSIRQSGFSADARAATATLSMRADGPSTYVARLTPVGEHPCARAGAVLEVRGTLSGDIGSPWTNLASAEFEGLCAGGDYSLAIELTDSGGAVSVWDEHTWGVPALFHVREMAVPITIGYRLNSDTYYVDRSPYFAALTMRAGDQVLVGPHAGGCFGGTDGFTGSKVLPVLRLGEHVHLSGSVQTALIDADQGCVVDWATSSLAITFEADFTLEELLTAPDGIVLRVDQPLDADPSIRAQASAIIRIRAN